LQIPDSIGTSIVLNDEYFDVKGLAAYSKLGPSTIRYHIRENSLPCFKIPGKKGNAGRVLIKRSEFDGWLERYRDNDFQCVEVIADEIIDSLKKAESKD
jgi:hypothetical protein